MSTTSCFILLLFLVVGISAAQDTIYTTLQYYGFPPGLVPKDVVTRFDLNPSTGQFAVYLNTTCAFSAYNYDVQFKTQVTGVITREEIENIHGVQVKVINNYWVDLQTVEMVEDSEEIEFSSGIMAADFPVYYFFNIPECGCGFDCGQHRHAPVPGPAGSN